jgi:hypothetical protein
MPTVIRHIHLDQNIPGKELPLGIDLGASAKFYNLLHRHQNLFDVIV